ncbi:uncharacterized protein LOC133791537 isoform X2 [Humulus lupulus]|uniref:uncharacterized protein LOC133791537 isoform X2 n=1 Tax=Humulus lupulus TaxID=3486 RepID=UPI002B40AF2A|nr:uncharacterized protein LOC133791537 isoform X2 [Humulus lupulus]
MYGQPDAFFCLNSMCLEHEQCLSYSIRTEDDQTILHCAIFGEDFELAFKIIQMYKELVNHPDKKGHSPLHTLASKPSCLTSGIYHNLGGWDKIIYNLTIGQSSEYIENPERGSTHTSRTDDGHGFVPVTHATCLNLVKFIYKAVLITFGYGESRITKIREEKQKHLSAAHIVDELLIHSTMYDDEVVSAGQSETNEEENDKKGTETTKETAILIAARNGVSEIVERILQKFPVAIHDANHERKNVLLLAAENRHWEVYKLLLKRKVPRGLVFRKVDNQGNTALHYAAMLANKTKYFWPIPGDALQMQWEIKCLLRDPCHHASTYAPTKIAKPQKRSSPKPMYSSSKLAANG